MVALFSFIEDLAFSFFKEGKKRSFVHPLSVEEFFCKKDNKKATKSKFHARTGLSERTAPLDSVTALGHVWSSSGRKFI